MGAGIVSGERVYLVQIQGQFTLVGASRPPGVPPPQGDYLIFTFDPATDRVLDLGVGERPADLSALGSATSLEL